MAEVTPYLSIATFTSMFRTLSPQETALATMLLRAAAAWIRREFEAAGLTPPTVDPPDDMAVLVSFQVVRDALPAVEGWAGHTSYEWQTDDKREAGTLAEIAGFLSFDDSHRSLLGLPLSSADPIGGGFDSGFDVLADSRVLPGSVGGYVGW
jgi:hypothetical protein